MKMDCKYRFSSSIRLQSISGLYDLHIPHLAVSRTFARVGIATITDSDDVRETQLYMHEI